MALAAMVLTTLCARALDKEDGVYVINDGADLNAFAKIVNGGEKTASCRLTADIDYTAYNDLIGDGVVFCGTFDAQGHKVFIDTHTNSSVPGGLFGKGSAGAKIQDLWLEGTLTASGRRASGLIREGDGVFINNCVIKVDIYPSIHPSAGPTNNKCPHSALLTPGLPPKD